MAAYRGGENSYVTMIDSTGKAAGKPYTWISDSRVTGMIYYQSWVYIIQSDGTVTKIKEDLDPDTASVVKVKSDGYIHHGDVIQKDVILLTNRSKRTVFTVNMSTGEEKTEIRGLKGPIHVFRCDVDCQPVYVVTEWFGCHIKIYNTDWNLMREFGREGWEDGELCAPYCTAILPGGHLLVGDNHRISQFTQTGVFVKHLITNLQGPRCINFRDSMLWVVDAGRAACYQINDQ